MTACVAGVDFGTDSLRVGVHDGSTGETLLVARSSYRRWAAGEYCDARRSQFRQHPLDHLDALQDCFDQVHAAGLSDQITAVAVDSTGSTVAPVDRTGTPLAMLPGFEDDPAAMFWLWKDHTAHAEADQVNQVLAEGPTDYTTYQGRYHSEWWWAKILRAARQHARVRTAAVSWVEHSDWLGHLLTGGTDALRIVRNACAAGHKALYNTRLGGWVPPEVLGRADPYLAQVANTLTAPPVPAGTAIGPLSPHWAQRLHLDQQVVVGTGSLDAHAGAVVAGCAPGTAVKVLGTSAVAMYLVEPASRQRGLADLGGLAEDSIVPGYLGGESGQAAFGDLFGWWQRVLSWPLEHQLRSELGKQLGDEAAADLIATTRSRILSALETAALARPRSTVLALDWLNGRRYPDPDEHARAALLNLSVGHDAVDLYRALTEAAVLGSKAMYTGLVGQGVPWDRLVLIGGIARKSPMICQDLADALDLEVMVSPEEEACAKGAALFASVAAGQHASIPAAQQRWCPPFEPDYRPISAGVEYFNTRYQQYRAAGRALARHGGRPQELSEEEI